ncbi:iron transporter [Stutzerimonas stutzeri]|uniref:Iron transporter n=1 Tax=Stutzerimonas stutzeri TaxID=316 RepID=W8R080_STUST|nr:hypothetical protein [Stutzerimonas stutzeri]AHL76295.1 iron transporter [Stutzerimonas stutzeri]MCQ4329525.1 iron transporter [Stutzerimonas stutzeri]
MTRSVSQSRNAWPEIAIRTALAILGGYAFTYAFTAALAQVLPLDKVDALAISSLLSFVIYLAFILWAFAAASLKRVLVGVCMALPLAAIGFWPQLLGALK